MDGENNGKPIKVDDLGVPLFSETPISLRRLNFPFCCLFFFSMCTNHSNYSNLESTPATYSIYQLKKVYSL